MKTQIDPYRAIFPIGLFLGIWGVGSWLFYGFGLTSTYPGTYHASLMIGGFLFLMAVGFLMTAIPAFTETPRASKFELGFSVLAGMALAITGVIGRPDIFHVALFVEMFFLIFYAAKRIAKRQDDPPPTFIFIGLGLFCGVFGDFLMILEDTGKAQGNWPLLGHILFFQGMMLCLVLGVGSRLIPALLGWEAIPLEQIAPANAPKARFLTKKMATLLAVMIVLAASFVIEAFFYLVLGRVIRAAAATFIAYRFWKLLTLPHEKSWLARWLWFSGWCVILGLWGYALVPSYGIHLLHITFVGGFSLMTLMIATRVTIAHGDEEYHLEESSKALKWAGVLILFATATRILAPFTKNAYRSHLGYASLTWVLALILWGWVFFKRILIHKAPASPTEEHP